MEQKRPKTRVLFPIGAKLVIIITILLLVSLGAVIFLVSALSTQDVQRTAEDNNFTVNHRAGFQAEGSFKSVQAAALLYLKMVDRFSSASVRDPELERYFYDNNRNIAAIGVRRRDTEETILIPNEQFFLSNKINADDVKTYFDSGLFSAPDQMRFYNASPVFHLTLTTVVFIREGRAGDETVIALFSPDDLAESFGTGTNTSFLVTGTGDVLLHPDADLVLGGANFSSLPIVVTMHQEGDNNRQISFTDASGLRFFGAYYRLAGTDAAVITTIPHDIVFEAVQGITRQNMFLTGAVLFIAIMFIWFFSKTISSPVRALADAALRIEGGEFEIDLEPRTRDEVGLLTTSFGKMSSALRVFGHFVNKDIAIRAMRGEIKPGGLPKHATIFFSDIRGFTEKSENFTRAFGAEASDRIVKWLNQYFTHMVQCVEKTGGVVDKFIGDAVMAHWGTAFTAGTPQADAANCVKAALMMRQSLIEFNAQRKKDDPTDPEIRIGCGINTGVVTAGQIGSDQRMDYTAIGDPVNLANRVEALNKPLGTDILITEDTWELIGDQFITEEMPPVSVKGKEKPVRVFAVVNFRTPAGSGNSDGPQTLAQVRTLLGIKAPDLNMLDLLNTKEKKYLIHGGSSAGNSGGVKPEIKLGTEPMITMTSFGPSAWVHGAPGKAVPVFFSWTMHNFHSGIHVVVEVATDQDFTNIVQDRDLSGSASVLIPLENGHYWWRAYPANHGVREPVNSMYPCGTLKVDTDANSKNQSS